MFLRIAAILNEVLVYIRRFLFYIACRLIALGVSDLSPDRSLDIALFDHLPKDLTQRGRHQQIRIVDVLQSKAMDRVFVHFYASEGDLLRKQTPQKREAVLVLVERFDIEPFSDFSAK